MHRENVHAIDLNLLPVFDAVFREGSVSRAARHLHLTQPAVSHALARLRHHLGDALFVRRGREMVPTPRARALIEPVREALTALSRCLVESPDFVPRTAQRTLVVGLRDGLEACVLPRLVEHLDREAPGIALQSLTVPRRDLVHELSTGRLDLAMDVQLPIPPEIHQRTLLTDHLVVLMRAEHPLAKLRSLSLKRYLASRHVLVSSRRRGPSLEDFGLAQAGHRRDVSLRCQHYQAAMEVVAVTDLLLTLPSQLPRDLDPGGRFVTRTFPVALPRMGVYLYWHRDQHADPGHRWVREQIVASR